MIPFERPAAVFKCCISTSLRLQTKDVASVAQGMTISQQSRRRMQLPASPVGLARDRISIRRLRQRRDYYHPWKTGS